MSPARGMPPKTASLRTPKPAQDAIDKAPVRLRGLEEVPQSALGVVHLRLEVVTLADERSVQLDTGTDDPTQFVIRVPLPD